MKNKKGFTLVELLGVIAVLGVIMSIAFFSVSSVREKSLENILKTKLQQIEQAAVLYGQDNPSELNESCDVDGVHYNNYCKVITVRELIAADGGSYFESGSLVEDENGKYVNLINDVTNVSMLDDTVQIYRKNNRVYSVLLDIKSCEAGGGICEEYA